MNQAPEERWIVPSGWEWTRLSQLGDIVAGGTPSTKEPTYWGNDIHWISPSDLTGYTSKTIKRGAKSISKSGLANSSAKVMPSGSVHFSSRAPIGYVVISSEPLATNQGFKSLVPAPGIFNKYIYYYLIASQDYARKCASGTTFLELSGKAFGNLSIPIAPTVLQYKIVAKIEELFSELEKGVESLKKARAQLNIYRQAVLKHAFKGKLTAKWREENKDKLEKPEQLLARIQQERAAQYEKKLKEWKVVAKMWEEKGGMGKKPPRPQEPFYINPQVAKEILVLPKLPEGWSWFSLSAIVENIQIGPFGSLLHKADYLTGGTPLVNPSHIFFQRIEPDRSLTVSADKLSQLCKYVMHENDIVIGRRGEMGRCAVVKTAESGWLCGTGSLFIRLLSSMNPQFYSWVIASQRVKDFLAASSIGTTMRNLNEGIMHRVPVPVCSRPEQDEVFREIERQYSILDHIEVAVDSEIRKSAKLRQSILKKAFAGQLITQDPKDEPASVLLDRIRTGREKAMENNASKKRKKTAA